MIPEYKIREKKTFANYRQKAIVLMNDYNKFRKDYVDIELEKWLSEYRESHKQEFEAYSVRFKEGNDSSFITEFTAKHDSYFVRLFESKDLEIQGIEMFLLYNPDCANAVKLCQILFENCDINFNQERNDEEYAELLSWLLDKWDFFLGNHKKLTSLDLLVTRLKQITQSQTNQT